MEKTRREHLVELKSLLEFWGKDRTEEGQIIAADLEARIKKIENLIERFGEGLDTSEMLKI